MPPNTALWLGISLGLVIMCLAPMLVKQARRPPAPAY